jgi:hypothetical protein
MGWVDPEAGLHAVEKRPVRKFKWCLARLILYKKLIVACSKHFNTHYISPLEPSSAARKSCCFMKISSQVEKLIQADDAHI